MEKKKVAVSGGFDPLHPGHVRMMVAAKELGDYLLVILNNDNWLRAKKGYTFMTQDERREMILNIGVVDEVVLTDHEENPSDMSVVSSLQKHRPHIFGNAGDRTDRNTPEMIACDELGIEMAFGLTTKNPYENHSSTLIQAASLASGFNKRPWGAYKSYIGGDDWHLKTLHLTAGSRLSLQRHKDRDEFWMLTEGDATATLGSARDALTEVPLVKGEMIAVPRGTYHRLTTREGSSIVEVMQGRYDEDDIERFEDDYGRI